MTTFREYLLEDAGSLKGLPEKFKEQIVKGYEGGLGGKNSKIILFKANAKQKDVTAAAKKVGGYTKPTEQGRIRYSKQELEAQANKEAFAGVLIKVNNEPAFMATWSDYTDSGGNFSLLTDKGNVTVKRWYSNNRRGRQPTFETPMIKASEISDFIEFKEDKIDVYLVTADADRLLKRQERLLQGQIPEISKERKVVIQKFLTKKSGGLIEEIKSELNSDTDKILKYVEKMFSDSIEGKEISEESFDDIVKRLSDKVRTASRLSSYMKDLVKKGDIFDRNIIKTELNWKYKKFIELTKELKEI